MNKKLKILGVAALTSAFMAAPAFASDAGSALSFLDWLRQIIGIGGGGHSGSSGVNALAGPGMLGLVAIGLGAAVAMTRRRQG